MLSAQPNHAEALHLLGLVEMQRGRVEEAQRLISRALKANPRFALALANHGVVLERLGRADEALKAFEKSLAIKPEQPDALANCGNLLNSLSRFDAALTNFDRALALAPGSTSATLGRASALQGLGRHEEALGALQSLTAGAGSIPEAWVSRSHSLAALGRTSDALASIDRALSLDPDSVEAHNDRGILLLQMGRPADALASYEKALIRSPGRCETLMNRANALVALGRAEAALAGYDAVVKRYPDLAEAQRARSDILMSVGRHDAALAGYRRAIQIAPGLTDAHANAGVILHGFGRLEEARQSFEAALRLEPGRPDINYNLGNTLQALGRRDDAIASYDRALAGDAEHLDALVNKGNVLWELGAWMDAVATYERVVRRDPGRADARWKSVMALVPVLAATGETDDANRVDFDRGLGTLEGWAETPGAEDAVGQMQPFYLAYQERNNRDLLARYGRLCSHLMSRWAALNAIHGVFAAPGMKLRIGIVSSQIRDHSVWNALARGWVEHFDRDRFDVHLFHLGSLTDHETAWARSRAQSFDEGLSGLNDWASTIKARGIDVLIYPEIGMDTMTARLASLRLAPVQAVSWGHPETSGLPTIDAFITAGAFEPDGAEAAYTEKLIRLPRTGACYAPRPVVAADIDLARLGLGGRTLLLCPGMPFKYSTRHDAVFVALAKRLPEARLVFFTAARMKELSAKLQHRLAESFSAAGLDFARHATFIPWQTEAGFHGLMRKSLVSLDTMGFSGFNTAVQAIETGLPVMAWEGRFCRGRLASGVMRLLGLDELVADNEEAYVDAVVRLATEPGFRQHIVEQITQRRTQLFNDTETVRALEAALAGLHKDKCTLPSG